MLKVVKDEETVDIGKRKEDLLERKRENLKRKNLHVVFFKNTEFRDGQTWNWLRKGDLKKATEGTIMAAQGRSSEQGLLDIASTTRTSLCGEREMKR